MSFYYDVWWSVSLLLEYLVLSLILNSKYLVIKVT